VNLGLPEASISINSPNTWIDSSLQDKIHRDSYALRLDQRFNPTLPEFVYKEDDLKKMATEEGWNQSFSSTTPYDFLRSIHSLDTFFAFGKGPMTGIQPMNSDLVIELEPISEQDPNNMVLFGSRANTSALQAVSWWELIMTFENYREFRNPLYCASSGKFLLEDHVINKLVMLAPKPCIDQTISYRR
jgi:hypothetical protein